MDTANGNGLHNNGSGIPKNPPLDPEEFLLPTSVTMDSTGSGLHSNGSRIPTNPLDPAEFLRSTSETMDTAINANGLYNNGPGIPTKNPLDPEEFRRQGHMVVDFLADYYKNIHNYPVRSQVEPGYLKKLLPDSAPNHPEPIDAILRDVTDHIIPGITHWQSPNYFAYFPCSGSTAGFLGEMLSAGFNAVCFDWMSSPAATELEIVVTEWIGKLLDLPEEFLFAGGGGGVLLGTTCEAMLCTLTAARDKVLKRIGSQHIGRLVVYGSDQTHCSMQKTARIAGIRPENYRTVKTLKSDAFALSPDSLRSAISEDVAAGLVPLYLCATVGTTSSTAVDPLAALCSVAGEHGMWVHVDAAYAGAVCICPEFRRLFLDGVEGASSFSFNAHKWFLANLDCCCLWVKEPVALTEALSTNPEYLRSNASESRRVVNYKDWQVALSRRFRAMKMWLVLRSHGVANIRNLLRSHVRMAEVFEGLVSKDERFEVATPRNFAMVCFRLRQRTVPAVATNQLDELNRRLLEEVNASGKLYMTHAVVGGMYVIRFAVGATLTEETHVRSAWEVIQECAGNLLEENSY